MDAGYGIIQGDLPPVVHPVPTSIGSSSLAFALTAAPPQPPRERPPKRVRTSPPPFYNPYPYGPSWKLERVATAAEKYFWDHRQDAWRHDFNGVPYRHMTNRVFELATAKLAQKQAAAKKEWEDAQLARPPPPVPGAVDAAGAGVAFATVDGKRGVPVKMLLASRRALECALLSPKAKCFEKWPRDAEWVRIQWPAYPGHAPARPIVVSKRTSTKRPRRPITRVELAIELAGVITQYYSEAIALEPDPAHAHLALGPAEGRISLYRLRMMCLRPAPDGVFDIALELTTDEDNGPPRSSGPMTEADLNDLLTITPRASVEPAEHPAAPSSTSTATPVGDEQPEGEKSG